MTTTQPSKTKLVPKHSRHLKYAVRTAEKHNIILMERPKTTDKSINLESDTQIKQEQQPLIDQSSTLYNNKNKIVKLDRLTGSNQPSVPAVEYIIDTTGTTDDSGNKNKTDAIASTSDTYQHVPVEPDQPKRKKHKKSKSNDKPVEHVRDGHNDPCDVPPTTPDHDNHQVESMNMDSDSFNHHVQRDIRPSRVPRETVDYYKNIQSMLETNIFDSPDERNLMVNNVLNELCSHDDIDGCFSLLIHPIISHIVQYLLNNSALVQKQNLLHKINVLLIDLIYHKNGCHVIDTYLQCLLQDELYDQLLNVVQQCAAHQYISMISDVYATYPIRRLIQICYDCGQLINNYRQQFQSAYNTIVQQLMTLSIHDINTLFNHTCVIPVYQLLIRLTTQSVNQPLLQQFIDTLMLWYNNTTIDTQHTQLMSLVCNKTQSRLIESVIQLNNTEINNKLFDVLLHKPKNLLFLATHPIGNYSLQQLLSHLTTIIQLDSISSLFTAGALQYIIQQNKLSVVHAWLKSVVRFTYKPQHFIDLLCATLNATPNQLFMTLIQLSNNNINLHKHKSKYNTVGCSIVQQLIELVSGNNQLSNILYSSMLDASSESIQSLCTDVSASHVIDILITYGTNKQHEQLMKQLAGHYVNLVCNQYGSYVYEKLFTHVSTENKLKLCSELCRHMQRITVSHIGIHTIKKYKLELLKYNQSHWIQQQQNRSRTDELLHDIIGDDHNHNSSAATQQTNNSILQHTLNGGTAVVAEPHIEPIVDADMKQVLHVISQDKKHKNKHKQ